ncbi:MAG: GNAT family N-acetyltransferase [Anaerolineae bacterium]
MSDRYRLIERVATPEEYRALCTAVGWEAVINFEAANEALPNSLYGVVVECEERVVGMGRVVGDGAIFYYLQDIAVMPGYQGRGVGRRIVEQLVGHIKAVAPEKAFVGVFAAAGTERFYEEYGFRDWEALTGMYQVVAMRGTGREAECGEGDYEQGSIVDGCPAAVGDGE